MELERNFYQQNYIHLLQQSENESDQTQKTTLRFQIDQRVAQINLDIFQKQ